VAGDHYFESDGCRLQIKLLQIVQHIDQNATDLDSFGLRQSTRPRGLVDIAANRGNGRDARKFVKNLGRTNVPCVNDVFRPTQSLQRFQPKQSVGIGNDADQNGSSQFLRSQPLRLPLQRKRANDSIGIVGSIQCRITERLICNLRRHCRSPRVDSIERLPQHMRRVLGRVQSRARGLGISFDPLFELLPPHFRMVDIRRGVQ